MKFEFSNTIRNNFDGFDILVDFYNKTKDLYFEEVTLDFKETCWFDANLTAILGAILSRLQLEYNVVKIENLSSEIRQILSRNNFLSHFGGLEVLDYYGTTIKYRKFKISEERLLKDYLDRELFSNNMPTMSDLLRKKINESIFEIFNNSVIHGNCQNIFSCGQYYPQNKRLYFTIVDFGETIKLNVNSYLERELSGKDAIEWAVAKGHTTRKGSIPGGLGLSLIQEFLAKNNGKVQIVSADGYWEQSHGQKSGRNFSQIFPGTIVNLAFNIDDKYYCLASEIDKETIF